MYDIYLFAYPDTTYEELGCYNDKGSDRALPVLVGYFRPEINWFDLQKIIRKCAEETKKRGNVYRPGRRTVTDMGACRMEY